MQYQKLSLILSLCMCLPILSCTLKAPDEKGSYCPDAKPLLPRKFRATMSEDAEYAYMAARQAFEQAGIDDEFLRQNEVGCIWGNDGNPYFAESGKIMNEEHDSSMVEPQAQFKGETSTVSMNLATIFHLKGIGLSIGAACASSSHAIGIGKMLIQYGMQDMVMVGGACGVSKVSHAISDMFNFGFLYPIEKFSPFGEEGLGLIESGGAAVLLLEDYEHAVMRGVPILAEIVGYGYSSLCNITTYHPSANGIVQIVKNALKDAKITISEIDYINPCATGAKIDDDECIIALNQIVEGRSDIYISSTESITGHENWMLGASKSIYNILMMQNDFVAPNINLTNIEEEARSLNIIKETMCTQIGTSLVITAGLGGSGSAIIFRKI